MNTPAHIAASLFVWRGETSWGAAWAIALGALLPDAPMFGFYFYERVVAGSREEAIWSYHYFVDPWQTFFDVFNSIPVWLAVMMISRRCAWRFSTLLAASAPLHIVCDLPLHHDDAHRHFLPLSHWRFASPLSYWDPKHYGAVFIPLELVLALAACGFVVWRGARPMRRLALANMLVYALGIAWVVVVWIPD